MTQPAPLVIERTLKAPVDKVWQALTDQAQLQQWLPIFPDFKAEVGFTIRFSLGRDAAHQYIHLCKVKEVVNNQKLTYSWHYEGYPGYSSVSFELTPAGDQTKLKLIHTITEAFPADNPDFAAEGFKQGWTYTADALKEFVEK